MEKMFLGVSKKDITPHVGCLLFGYMDDLRSDSVHDNLDATAFVFKQGDRSAVMVSLTLVCLQEDTSNTIRNAISKATGVPFDNIVLACTHTHSGPAVYIAHREWGTIREEEYMNTVLIPNVVAAATEANANLTPVTMGYATGESYIGINRRELTIDNKVILGQNPWGPYNPRMTVISFRTLDGENFANMIHFGMHGTCSGMNTEITQDWAGVMVRRMEALTGCTTAFFNGPEGDIGPRLTNGKTTGIGKTIDDGDVKYAEETGGRAAFDAMEIYKKIKRFDVPTLNCHAGVLKLPLCKRLTVEEAQHRYDELSKIAKTGAERALMSVYKDVIASYDTDYVDKEYNEIPQTVIKLDNVTLVNYPYEMFSEIGMRIQKEFPDAEVLPVCLCNGHISYFPTEDQFVRGGYEIAMFKAALLQEYVHDVDYHLVLETVKNINKKEY